LPVSIFTPHGTSEAVELSRSHVMACVSERTAIIGGGRHRSVGAINPLREIYIDHNCLFLLFFFSINGANSPLLSHCSKAMIRTRLLCVNRSEGPKCETARLRQQNRKCLNILYRQSHVAARAGGGLRLARYYGSDLAESGLFKDNVQRPLDPTGKGTQKRHLPLSSLLGKVRVCYIFAVGVSCLCRYRDDGCMMPCSTQKFIFVYDIADIREQVRECSSGHSPRIKRCKQPGRAWQPAQGRKVCPSA